MCWCPDTLAQGKTVSNDLCASAARGPQLPGALTSPASSTRTLGQDGASRLVYTRECYTFALLSWVGRQFDEARTL